MYKRTTRSIEVTVRPTYLEEQSEPDSSHYVWAYWVRIENHSDKTVQLYNRRWKITDAFGRNQEVEGEGVVGEQPILRPGEAFEYTSGTPLTTPSGIMVGTYELGTEDGKRFEVNIPAFSLDSPYQEIQIH